MGGKRKGWTAHLLRGAQECPKRTQNNTKKPQRQRLQKKRHVLILFFSWWRKNTPVRVVSRFFSARPAGNRERERESRDTHTLTMHIRGNKENRLFLKPNFQRLPFEKGGQPGSHWGTFIWRDCNLNFQGESGTVGTTCAREGRSPSTQLTQQEKFRIVFSHGQSVHLENCEVM